MGRCWTVKKPVQNTSSSFPDFFAWQDTDPKYEVRTAKYYLLRSVLPKRNGRDPSGINARVVSRKRLFRSHLEFLPAAGFEVVLKIDELDR